MQLHILLIDDDRDTCGLLAASLGSVGYAVTWCSTADEANVLLQGRDFDLVITDLDLDGSSGIEICKRMKDNRPNTPVIVLTGCGDMSSAVDALHAGAHDFMTKPLEFELLEHAIERAHRISHLREQLSRLKQAQVPSTESLGALVGTSQAMRGVYDLICRVAASDTTVLLSGESGTGKELVALLAAFQTRANLAPRIGSHARFSVLGVRRLARAATLAAERSLASLSR